MLFRRLHLPLLHAHVFLFNPTPCRARLNQSTPPRSSPCRISASIQFALNTLSNSRFALIVAAIHLNICAAFFRTQSMAIAGIFVLVSIGGAPVRVNESLVSGFPNGTYPRLSVNESSSSSLENPATAPSNRNGRRDCNKQLCYSNADLCSNQYCADVRKNKGRCGTDRVCTVKVFGVCLNYHYFPRTCGVVSSCSPCPPGQIRRFCGGTSSGVCYPCSSGTHKSITGTASTQCTRHTVTQCSSGEYLNAYNSRIQAQYCSPCQAGYYK